MPIRSDRCGSGRDGEGIEVDSLHLEIDEAIEVAPPQFLVQVSMARDRPVRARLGRGRREKEAVEEREVSDGCSASSHKVVVYPNTVRVGIRLEGTKT